MSTYVTLSLNHFAAVQRWAQATGAAANLDLRDFTMEVKHRGRYFRMHPMFQCRVDGRLAHIPQLTPQVKGFGGWRPYQTLTHPHSSDKKLFKAFLEESGLRCPAAWDAGGSALPTDYVLKERSGSFGEGLYGPFRAGDAPRADLAQRAAAGGLFAEQFVHGRMLKVWFWGARPFFAHDQEYPSIVGHGGHSVGELLLAKLEAAGMDGHSPAQKQVPLDCLAFQGLALADVLAPGRTAWIDYRYSQLYAPSEGGTLVSDNALDTLLQASGDQVPRLGQALAALLQKTMPVPVAITVDGLLDAEGRIWWLEMNTNSVMPPEGYATMFADLFG